MSDSLTKTVNAWNALPKHNRIVFLVGFSNTGRTTFAELTKRFQFGIINPALSFEKDKYQLENVISAKSIKIQTNLPVPYPSNGPDKILLVDVPCFCLTPELKKWTVFDQKITTNLMMHTGEKVGFLLFV